MGSDLFYGSFLQKFPFENLYLFVVEKMETHSLGFYFSSRVTVYRRLLNSGDIYLKELKNLVDWKTEFHLNPNINSFVHKVFV